MIHVELGSYRRVAIGRYRPLIYLGQSLCLAKIYFFFVRCEVRHIVSACSTKLGVKGYRVGEKVKLVWTEGIQAFPGAV